MNKDKYVLCLLGGTMQGVFGAGVVTYLQDINFYNQLEAVYGSSVGVPVGAYFLSHQTRLGSSIFYEDLTHSFVSKRDFWGGIWDRFRNRFLYQSAIPIRDAINLDYLMNIFKRVKKMDVVSILDQHISFYAKVLNITDCKVEYKDIKNKHFIDFLRAAITAQPYVGSKIIIQGKAYCDAALADMFGVVKLIHKYPNHKFIIVVNEPLHRIKSRTIRSYVKKWLEKQVIMWMYGRDVAHLYSNYFKRAQSELGKLLDNDSVLFIEPNNEDFIQAYTTNSARLRKTYQAGYKAAESAINKL